MRNFAVALRDFEIDINIIFVFQVENSDAAFVSDDIIAELFISPVIDYRRIY